jgi:ribosomal protein L34E
MKQTKTYCDICGTEIEKGYGSDKGNLKLVGRVSKSQTRVDQIMWDDLCHTCTSELFSVLNKFKRAKK